MLTSDEQDILCKRNLESIVRDFGDKRVVRELGHLFQQEIDLSTEVGNVLVALSDITEW